MDRIACAFVPRYELALRARVEPELWQTLAAVSDLASRPARLLAVTPAAEARGLFAGMVLSHARALCPELSLLSPDPEALAASEREILGALGTLSPQLDTDGRGAFFLGLAGLERLIGSEEAFAGRVRAALAELGIEARVAIADHSFAAWAEAQRARPIEIAPPGTSAERMEHIPLSALGLSEPAQALLSMLGVKSAAGIAALPPGSLGRRLGPEGKRLEALCRGDGQLAHPSASKVPAEPARAVLELELPIEDHEALLFCAKSLLDRVLAELGRDRRALAELTVTARLDDRSEVARIIAPARPTLESAGLLDLLRLWLETRPFSAAVAALELLASRTAVADARQLQLFARREEEEAEALSRAVARLVAAFGRDRVVRPHLADSYRPERRVRWEPFAAAPPRRRAQTEPGRRCPLVLRLFAEPEPVSWQPGAPLRRGGQPPAEVTAIDGPQRLAGEWWETAFDRSYYWLTLADGALCWVYRDEQGGGVYLHGLAD